MEAPRNKFTGTSYHSWEDASRNAVNQAVQAGGEIHQIHVIDQRAVVEHGEIVTFVTTVQIGPPDENLESSSTYVPFCNTKEF